MAALILSNRRRAKSATKSKDPNDSGTSDFDAAFDEMINTKKEASSPRVSGRFSSDISAEILIGMLPNPEDIIKEAILGKLTSQYSWKPMRVALTQTDMLFCKTSEDVLKDSIPLHEILDIKKRTDMPGVTGGQAHIDSTYQARTNLAALFDEEVQHHDLHIIQIRTIEGGHNSGRTYYLNAETGDDCKAWIDTLSAAADAAEVRHLATGPSFLHRSRRLLRRLYNTRMTQFFVGALILISFAINIAQAELQLDPASAERRRADAFFQTMEYILTALFTAELLVNMAAHWFWPFFTSGWCLFDLVVIAFSLFAIAAPDFPAITALRLVRTLRCHCPAPPRPAPPNASPTGFCQGHRWA